METNSWQIFPGTMALAVTAFNLFGSENVFSGYFWTSPVTIHDQTEKDIKAFVELINERVSGHYYRKL